MIALLVDIGNTRVKWRIAGVNAAEDARSDRFPTWVSAEEAMGLRDIGSIDAAFRDAAGAASIDVAIIANVASDTAATAVENAVSAAWRETPVRVARSAAAAGGLANGYRDPLQLGVDRWLAAVAAHALYADRSILVCTFGTATTIDLVEQHRFVGGLILPGVDAMQRVLTTSTARLPAAAGQVVDFADRTEDAITSGVMAAQIGAVERALCKARARPQTDAASTPMCVVAGGAAETMSTLFDRLDTPHRVVHDLVLRGLAHVARETALTPRSFSDPHRFPEPLP